MSFNSNQEEDVVDFKNIPTFIIKIYTILNDPENASIVSWSQSGDSFSVKNIKMFCQEVLPRYFKHRKFQSFVRQLNMYNFSKLKERSIQIYSNQYFQKDKPYLLEFIKRKQQASKKKNEILFMKARTAERNRKYKEKELKENVQTKPSVERQMKKVTFKASSERSLGRIEDKFQQKDWQTRSKWEQIGSNRSIFSKTYEANQSTKELLFKSINQIPLPLIILDKWIGQDDLFNLEEQQD